MNLYTTDAIAILDNISALKERVERGTESIVIDKFICRDVVGLIHDDIVVPKLNGFSNFFTW